MHAKGDGFVTDGGGRARGTTLWERIHATVGGEIDEGRYPPGSKLPTEAELANRFGVNRHTVRRALEALTREGRIHTRRGAGAFVTQGRFDYAVGPKMRLTRTLSAMGMAPSRRVLRLEELPADEREAAALELPVGAKVAVLESIAEADGVPIIYGRAAYPASRLPGILDALGRSGRITEALREAGVSDYTRVWTKLLAERPGANIARHLQMPETHPVLHAEGLSVDEAGRPVEHGDSWFCSDRVQLVVDRASFAGEGG